MRASDIKERGIRVPGYNDEEESDLWERDESADESKRRRRYTITMWKRPSADLKEQKCIKYFISGEEKAPTTGKIHYQTYMELNKGMSFKKIKELLGDEKAWIMKSRGNATQNKDYCRKDGKVVLQFGKPGKQGKRNDLVAFRKHFQDGGTKKRAIEGDFLTQVAKYPRLANTLEAMYEPKRDFSTELHIYWGPTRTGKTTRAFAEAKELGSVYFKPRGTKWWDGYEGQDSVILEDFRGETSLAEMLVLCDRTPLRVQTKGGHRQFRSKRIYITSNTPPREWFNHEQKGYKESMAALAERVTNCENMTTRVIPSMSTVPVGFEEQESFIPYDSSL